MPRAGMLLAVATGAAMAMAGANPWLALSVVAIWLGSLWLARPEPTFERQADSAFTVSRETIAPFIEPLGVPLLLLDGERIVAANRAARDTLGGHIVGQDARMALRHPEAVGLLASTQNASATVQGLTGVRSIWELSRFRIDERFGLIELINRTAEADISRAHTDFVANASHELRTPLASVIGYLETLRDPASKVETETQRKFLGTMHNEARRMQSLVEDLLSLSRIEAEKHDAPREGIDLASIARSVASDVAQVQGSDRIALTAPADEVMILGDRSQIDQLLRNLIDNAIKYGSADSPVRVSVERAGMKVVLAIADTGPGIAREHLPYLTRRFYRTDPGRSRASGGTGLGLAIVKHIVERHRGELDIASVVGQGTTVTARFPQAKELSQ